MQMGVFTVLLIGAINGVALIGIQVKHCIQPIYLKVETLFILMECYTVTARQEKLHCWNQKKTTLQLRGNSGCLMEAINTGPTLLSGIRGYMYAMENH